MASAVVCMMFFIVLICGCRGKKETDLSLSEDKVVIQLGDSVLYEHEVYARIPAGITSQDSAMLYDAIVQDWLEKRLLVDVAELNLPAIERIEKMVEDYRMQLITNEYRRVMAESNVDAVSDAEIARYYNAHRDELRLQWPLVKGVYVKVSSYASHLEDIRRWISSEDLQEIEQLENYGLRGAMQYDNFKDTWVSWKSLSELIPWRFDESADFLVKDFVFDKTIGSSVYMVRILDVMPEGEVMPMEFARKEISRILADRKRSSYDSDLIRQLYDDAVKSKRLHSGGYVPLKFRSYVVPAKEDSKH